MQYNAYNGVSTQTDSFMMRFSTKTVIMWVPAFVLFIIYAVL